MRIADVTAEALAEVNDKELLSLHRRCHQLAGSLFATARERAEDDLEGKLTWEDLVNAHALIVAEMEAREMNHNLRDRLDRESARVEKGAVSLEYLKARLAEAQDVVVVENFISIAGSVVQKGERAGDVDLVIRQDRRDPGLEILTRKVFDPEKRGYLHWVYQATGPHADYIPAFDLVLRPKREFKVHTVKAAPLKVDLGCGPNKPDGYFGIDKKYFEGVDQVWDLENGIPLPDESAEEVRAVHVLEHLSDPEHIMAEIWRVLVPGGKLVFEVPSTKGEGAWAHPGHKSGWNKSTFAFWTEEDLLENRPRFEVEQIEEETKGDLVYVRGILRKPLGEDVQKRAIKPIARFEMPKPAMKHYAQTEAFSPDEIWPWVERHLENGVVSEPKLNGFRCCIQKAGSRVSIYFEDAQEERNKQLPDLVAALERVNADFILDCNVGVEEGGRPWPRIKLMTLTADEPELPEGAYVKATLFDLVYWGEDIHTKPFRERRRALEEFYAKYLKHDRHFAITPQLSIRSHADLEAAWRRQGIQTPMSEGIVLKDLEAPYTLGPSTDALAKVKKMVEVKAWVLDVKRNRNGTYGFRGGLLLGDARFANVVAFRGEKVVDLGWSFNAPFKADVGDVVTFEVEEIIPQEKDGKEELAWLGAKPVDVDKTRTKPYFANQVVDIARRGGVLQKAAPADEGETRGERAERFWKENWYKLYPKSGKGRYVIHEHWRGLSEDEVNLPREELIRRGHSLHSDLRLESNGVLHGWTVFLGKAEDNATNRLISLPSDDNLQVAPKLAQPTGWLTFEGVSEPGEVGATTGKYARFDIVDSGTYEAGVWREHMMEYFCHGKKLNGRLLVQYAPLGGRRVWIIDRPEDQKPYAESHGLEDVVKELKEKGQKWLWWKKPGEKPRLIDVGAFELKKASVSRIVPIAKVDSARQIVYGIVLDPYIVDSQGDWVPVLEVEKAAHRYLVKSRTIGDQHKKKADAELVESWLVPYPTPEDYRKAITGESHKVYQFKFGESEVHSGAWVVGIHVISKRLWQEVQSGEKTGLSIGAVGERTRNVAQALPEFEVVEPEEIPVFVAAK